jgi:tRNA dimethylallyltransferase
VNAGVFADYATPLVQELLQKKGSVVIAGGTGLYIKALLGGLDYFPEVSPEIREQLSREWSEDHGASLRKELERTDHSWYSRIDLQNPRRVLRALEIIRVSGQPYSSFLGKPAQKWDAEIHFFYPDPIRSLLYEKIALRVRKMIEEGLEMEVRSLLPWREHPALQSVGYREFFEYFDGKTDLESTVENITRHTRNYAKRQWTWFRNQGDWTPIDPEKWEPSDALRNHRKINKF